MGFYKTKRAAIQDEISAWFKSKDDFVAFTAVEFEKSKAELRLKHTAGAMVDKIYNDFIIIGKIKIIE